MMMKKKAIFAKLMKLVGRGNRVQSWKMDPVQMYAERKKMRQRTSTSSQNSQFEPMPTIFEEDEAYCQCEEVLI